MEQRKPGTEIESAEEQVSQIKWGGGKYLNLFALFFFPVCVSCFKQVSCTGKDGETDFRGVEERRKRGRENGKIKP